MAKPLTAKLRSAILIAWEQGASVDEIAENSGVNRATVERTIEASELPNKELIALAHDLGFSPAAIQAMSRVASRRHDPNEVSFDPDFGVFGKGTQFRRTSPPRPVSLERELLALEEAGLERWYAADEARARQVIDMHRAGMTGQEIAQKLGLQQSVVSRTLTSRKETEGYGKRLGPEEFRSLSREGFSAQEIAELTGAHIATVRKHLKGGG